MTEMVKEQAAQSSRRDMNTLLCCSLLGGAQRERVGLIGLWPFRKYVDNAHDSALVWLV